MSRAEEIEQCAAEWAARRDRDDWTESDEAALCEWVESSVEHRIAYLRLENAWRRADRLRALHAPPAPLRDPVPSAAREPYRIIARIAAVLPMAVVLGAAFTLYIVEAPGQAFATALGEQRNVRLADGSTLELNTDTALRARMAWGDRTVWLDKGEVYFRVAHDPSHPFVIHAGERTVTVLGTEFDVRADLGRFDVVVEHGRVRVAAAGDRVLTSGDVLDLDDGHLELGHKTPAELAGTLSWRTGVLIFGGARLEEVAAEFNRYNGVKLVLADDRAKNLRIGGRFAAANVESFVRILQSAFHVHLKREGETVTISG